MLRTYAPLPVSVTSNSSLKPSLPWIRDGDGREAFNVPAVGYEPTYGGREAGVAGSSEPTAQWS